MLKVLTREQIEDARWYRENQRLTKRQLAEKYGVSPTTIWENVFATKKRIRIYVKTQPRPKCENCERVVVRAVKDRFIPHNYQAGSLCLSCYLEQRGMQYWAYMFDLLNNNQ